MSVCVKGFLVLVLVLDWTQCHPQGAGIQKKWGEEWGWVMLGGGGGVAYGCLCGGGSWGESGRAGCIRSRV